MTYLTEFNAKASICGYGATKEAFEHYVRPVLLTYLHMTTVITTNRIVLMTLTIERMIVAVAT